MYKHYFFDFDGTLFNGYPHIIKCFNLMMKKSRGVEYAYADLYKLFMHSARFAFNHFNCTENEIELYRNYQRDNTILPNIEPFNFTKTLLECLKNNGATLYIYTNRGDSLYELLEKYELTNYFKDFIIHALKPDPTPLNLMVEKYHLNKDECIVIGDRELDIKGAHNADITSFFFGEGNPYNSEYYSENLLDLLEV